MAFYNEDIIFKKTHKKKTNSKTSDKLFEKRKEKKKICQNETLSCE